MEAKKFRPKDLGYGLIVPVLIGLIIVAFPAILRPTLNDWFPSSSQYSYLTSVFTHVIAQIVVFAVPVVLGLVWNKWSGGAAGFIMGTLLYVASAGYFTAEYGYNLWRDPSFIGNYIVCGMLIGFIAGSLNNGSFRFKRMLGASLVASVTVGFLQFFFNTTVALYGAAAMSLGDPLAAFLRIMLPNLILSFAAPTIAKVMTLYALYPNQRRA